MTTWAVLATGPSMSQVVADQVRGRCPVVAISDAFRLAPWADALVSTDMAWWRVHPDAANFAGLKFTGAPYFQVMAGVDRLPGAHSGTNSGLLGMMAAHYLGATRILMCGFDLRGTHFFGKHPLPLCNTTSDRFDGFKKQFAMWRPRGLEIVNCTPDSALTAYARCDLATALQSTP